MADGLRPSSELAAELAAAIAAGIGTKLGSGYQASAHLYRTSAGDIVVKHPHGGGSLRGMSAEFFTQPSDARGRIVSCASGAAACAADSADRFCRSRGWTAASYHCQETVAGRNFLADDGSPRARPRRIGDGEAR